jgi:Ca2+-binding RTX toxin-like protein
MATINVNSSTELRTAIQAATSVDDLVLQGAVSFPTVTTLGKTSPFTPPTILQSGYTVRGSSTVLASSATIQDTRIYQQNVDGFYAPGAVKNLTLNYSSASNGRPILSYNSTFGQAARSILIDNVAFTGTSTGWGNGNGGVYISLLSSSSSQPTQVDFTLQGSSVAVTGQSGSSAFLRSWNNNATVVLSGNRFDEAGFASSFNFLSYNPAQKWGAYTLTSNVFTRSANQTVRSEGNKLGSVTATLTGNEFRLGSFLDLEGDVSAIAFGDNNQFFTIPNGFGIRATNTVSNPIIGTPTFTGVTRFTGFGLALKYVSATAGAYTVVPSAGGTFSIDFQVSGQAPVIFDRLSAGSQVADTIDFSTTSDRNWLSGDDGNDTITGGSAVDYILGGSGNDSLTGGAGNDSILGGTGFDVLFGDAGDDTLNGGANNDTLTGGAGADRFQWLLSSASDTITDFTTTDGDTIALSKATNTFTSTAVNNLLAAADYITKANLSDIVTGPATDPASSSGKLTKITNGQTTAAISGYTAANLTTAYILVADSGSNVASLIYDADWSNTTGRTTLNLGTVSLGGISNTNFFIQV